jgi:hypothetical protein
MRRPHWRKMTWALIIWSAVVLIWAITGASANDCAQQTYKTACQAGTGIGVAIILLIGFFGFAFLTMIWFMSRPRARSAK